MADLESRQRRDGRRPEGLEGFTHNEKGPGHEDQVIRTGLGLGVMKRIGD